MAETAEAPTLEQEVSTLFGSPDGTATPPPEASTETPAPEVKPSESPETPPEQANDLETKLKEIPDAPEVKEQAPAVSDDQKQILQAFPTTQAAQQAITEASYFRELSNAVVNGDYETVLGAFEEKARQGFEEYLYQKYVASSPEWIDRWVAENDGTAPVHKGMTALEQKIARLEARLAEKESAEAQTSQKAQTAQLQTGYNNYLNNVFDKFQFSPADRRYVAADVTGQISQNPQLMAQYRAGNFDAFNTVVKNAIRDYSMKDQVKNQATEKVLAQQEKKKDLIQGSGAAVVDSLPDNIKDVPKGKEDTWMVGQLNKLFSR